MTDNQENQERPNDIEAMQAALNKANAEALKHREKRDTFRNVAVRLATEKALSQAGLSNPKVAKYLNMSELRVTEAGEIEGLTEQLDTLKEDLPELFGEAKKISGGADAADKREARPSKTSADVLAEQLFGN
ncbi:phage scaffolding protein [Streptomyces fragilis]|uniref:Phage scaffolding protein n=1 Tax=Streptomyces fragilis TaxID=67301 RepID=A0ABV2YAJ4_9ACTN|nr:phage scaffolding protein [Streptomyces fragilis]